MRNHQASIKNIEAQLGQLTTLVNEQLPPKIPDNKPQPHVVAISTEEDTIYEFVEALDEDTKQPDPQPKRKKINEKDESDVQVSRRGDYMFTSWVGSGQKNSSFVQPYLPPLPFTSQAKAHPLVKEHKRFI